MKKRAVSLIICMAMVGTIMACGNNAAPLEVVDEAPQAISVVEESTESEETDTSVSEGNSDAPAGEEEKETVTTGGYMEDQVEQLNSIGEGKMREGI